jgi:hypothetical protein
MQHFTDEQSYVYLRYNWTSTSERLQAVVATLAESFRQSRGTVMRQVNTDFAPAFNVVLTALSVCQQHSHCE